MMHWKESGDDRVLTDISYYLGIFIEKQNKATKTLSQDSRPYSNKGTSPAQVREVKTTQTHLVAVVSSPSSNKENNSHQYSHVVLPPISMMHLHSLEISRLLKGRTRTATFTDDMFKSASNTHTHMYSQT